MGALETAIIYLTIGLTAAAAVALSRRRSASVADGVPALLATALFWPFYAPFILSQRTGTRHEAEVPRGRSPVTAAEARIQSTEAELIHALGRLEGVAEGVLAPEVERVHRLGDALRATARRLAELEGLLATPELSIERARAALLELDRRGAGPGDPRRQSVTSRARNIERLEAMRARTAESLERALLELEDLGAQILVVRFAGRPEAELVHSIQELTATIEGVAEGLLAGT